MRAVIAGGSGFIGRALTSYLLAQNWQVTVLTRSQRHSLPAGAAFALWPGSSGQGSLTWAQVLEGASALINLAGASIAGKRWSEQYKQTILESRLHSTRRLVEAIAGLPDNQRPRVLINASAVGYYGSRGEEPLTEDSSPGHDFLSQVCIAWEKEALRAEEHGTRVVLLRTGMVLAKDVGALPRLLLPFHLYVGGRTGSGRQWMSWIHIQDLVRLIYFLLCHPQASGPFNAVAPRPVTNMEFCRIAARVLKKPAWLPQPEFVLRLLLGEMADSLLLASQRALPERALEKGFVFAYPDLIQALQAIFQKSTG
ncbi:TIGR01777 family oxidoreductase [Desulfurispora thermophila]|uniref:TIGR01777 family oxidoreductase n=1 Tax=Desulfurispora thermophila TaxID=265470 RepID=UPI00036F62F5|nr:TIGR01777 family oxidoreductase [Desulfurispora thermophila]